MSNAQNAASAIADFTQAIHFAPSLSPNCKDYYDYRAKVREETGDRQGAEEDRAIAELLQQQWQDAYALAYPDF